MVCIELHDLILGVIAFDLKRQSPLVHLSFESLLFGEKQILGKLLRERRATFDLVAGQVLPGCTNDANGINTHVIVEARILNGKDGVLHHGRNLFILKRDSFLKRKLANYSFAVVRINSRDYARPVSCQCGNLISGAGVVELVGRNNAG